MMIDINREPKVGDRICVKLQGLRFRTPVWCIGSKGTIVKLNPKTVAVRFDAYPEEVHRIDYGDYEFLDE